MILPRGIVTSGSQTERSFFGTKGRNKALSKSPIDKHTKTTKIIGGHGMAIRDFCKTSRKGEYAKLNDHSVTMKEFGQHDNNGLDSM